MRTNTLEDIPVTSIAPNPYNPRLIFDEKDLDDLKESIRHAGILVPVTVYVNDEKNIDEEFILLDGERRWRCAKDLGLETVPANIVDRPKDVTQNILFMFNIHYFRKQWDLFPTALKLERIIDLLKTDKDSILSSTTGLNPSTVKRCKMLLWYPEKYRDLLLWSPQKVSTDFFIEFYPIAKRLREEPEFTPEESFNKVVDALIDKFVNVKAFVDVKDLREMRKASAFYDSKNQYFEFKDRLRHFLSSSDAGIEVFTVLDLEAEKLKSGVLKNTSYLLSVFDQADLEFLSDHYILDQFSLLRSKLDEVILKIG